MGKTAFTVLLMTTVFRTVDVGQRIPPPSIRIPIDYEKHTKSEVGFIKAWFFKKIISQRRGDRT